MYMIRVNKKNWFFLGYPRNPELTQFVYDFRKIRARFIIYVETG